MLKRLTTGSILVGLLALSGVASAQARELPVTRARVTFRSQAQLETINGVSNEATGSVRVDPANLAATRGRVVVRVASLRTGIDLRDEHLHSAEWLDAAGHPEMVFEITGVTGASSLPANEDVTVQIRGRLTLHGQTRDVTAEARVRWDGTALRGRARFEIRLSDYGVSINEAVRLKVSNTIGITVDLRAGG
ncbi:MAG: YceI family protein [Sandaracinus sp.]|nr:YceI family protein [Sandaracinus sp.]MCB9633748.1 YceI family protein [Sandaracinus sp.]